jgi:hypothetical protein
MQCLMRQLVIAIIIVCLLGTNYGCIKISKSPLSAEFLEPDEFVYQIEYGELASWVLTQRSCQLIDSFNVALVRSTQSKDNSPVFEYENVNLIIKCGMGESSFFARQIKLYRVSQPQDSMPNHGPDSSYRMAGQIVDSTRNNSLSKPIVQENGKTSNIYRLNDFKYAFSYADSCGTYSGALPGSFWRADIKKMRIGAPGNCPLDAIKIINLESTYKARIAQKGQKKRLIGSFHEYGHFMGSAYVSDSAFIKICR